MRTDARTGQNALKRLYFGLGRPLIIVFLLAFLLSANTVAAQQYLLWSDGPISSSLATCVVWMAENSSPWIDLLLDPRDFPIHRRPPPILLAAVVGLGFTVNCTIAALPILILWQIGRRLLRGGNPP